MILVEAELSDGFSDTRKLRNRFSCFEDSYLHIIGKLNIY